MRELPLVGLLAVRPPKLPTLEAVVRAPDETLPPVPPPLDDASVEVVFVPVAVFPPVLPPPEDAKDVVVFDPVVPPDVVVVGLVLLVGVLSSRLSSEVFEMLLVMRNLRP